MAPKIRAFSDIFVEMLHRLAVVTRRLLLLSLERNSGLAML